jgi:hypothetical protein
VWLTGELATAEHADKELTMKNLVLIPVEQGPRRGQHAVRIDTAQAAAELMRDNDVGLAARSLDAQTADNGNGAAGDAREPVAALHGLASGDERAWYLVPHAQDLQLNGKRPLSLAALEPGDIVSVGSGDWWVAQLFTPTRIDPPENLAGKCCPVCGFDLVELKIPVVGCSCGRTFYHLEKPEEPDNPDVLNCWLKANQCASCQQPCSMEPRLIPEAPIKLFDQEKEEEE